MLITGGTGFVGANLARRLLRDWHEVHLLVKPSYQSWRIEPIRTRLHLHVALLENLDHLRDHLREIRPHWIYHLATHGAYSWQTKSQEIFQTNVLGLVNLLTAGLEIGFEAFVNTGSSSEYGFKDHAPNEYERLEPNSCYAVSKAAATMYCQFMARRFRIRIPTLRLYSVYGPWEHPARLIPTLIMNGFLGLLPPLVNPLVARDFVYIDDVVQAYVNAAQFQGDDLGAVFNLGTGRQSTIADVVGIARRLLRVQAEPVWDSMENRMWDTNVWIADVRRSHAELGWRAETSLEEGIKESIDWFRGEPGIKDYYIQQGKNV